MLQIGVGQGFMVVLALFGLLLAPVIISEVIIWAMRRRAFASWAAAHSLELTVGVGPSSWCSSSASPLIVEGLWLEKRVRCECVEKGAGGGGAGYNSRSDDWLLVSLLLRSPVPAGLIIEAGNELPRLETVRLRRVTSCVGQFDRDFSCHAMNAEAAGVILADSNFQRALSACRSGALALRLFESTLEVVANAGRHTRHAPTERVGQLFDAVAAVEDALVAARATSSAQDT